MDKSNRSDARAASAGRCRLIIAEAIKTLLWKALALVQLHIMLIFFWTFAALCLAFLALTYKLDESEDSNDKISGINGSWMILSLSGSALYMFISTIHVQR